MRRVINKLRTVLGFVSHHNTTSEGSEKDERGSDTTGLMILTPNIRPDRDTSEEGHPVNCS